MSIERKDIRHWSAVLTYGLLIVCLAVLLAVFHGVFVSFFVPQLGWAPNERVFGALLVGVPTFVLDVLAYKFVKNGILEQRWIAQNKRRHEEELARRR